MTFLAYVLMMFGGAWLGLAIRRLSDRLRAVEGARADSSDWEAIPDERLDALDRHVATMTASVAQTLDVQARQVHEVRAAVDALPDFAALDATLARLDDASRRHTTGLAGLGAELAAVKAGRPDLATLVVDLDVLGDELVAVVGSIRRLGRRLDGPEDDPVMGASVP